MIDWNYVQRHWDWAGHILEALVVAATSTRMNMWFSRNHAIITPSFRMSVRSA